MSDLAIFITALGHSLGVVLSLTLFLTGFQIEIILSQLQKLRRGCTSGRPYGGAPPNITQQMVHIKQWPACNDKTRRDYRYTTTTYASNLDHGEWFSPHACYGSDDVLQGLSNCSSSPDSPLGSIVSINSNLIYFNFFLHLITVTACTHRVASQGSRREGLCLGLGALQLSQGNG